MTATQGEMTKNDFETTSAVFDGAFTVDTSIKAPTVVYKSDEYWYPNGY